MYLIITIPEPPAPPLFGVGAPCGPPPPPPPVFTVPAAPVPPDALGGPAPPPPVPAFGAEFVFAPPPPPPLAVGVPFIEDVKPFPPPPLTGLLGLPGVPATLAPPPPPPCFGAIPSPPSFPCGGLTGGVFPVPLSTLLGDPRPPPPEPPFPLAAQAIPAPLPAPPPADVIVENIEFEPCAPGAQFPGKAPTPPAPTVIGKPAAVTGIAGLGDLLSGAGSFIGKASSAREFLFGPADDEVDATEEFMRRYGGSYRRGLNK